MPLRCGVRSAESLDRVPDSGIDPAALPVPESDGRAGERRGAGAARHPDGSWTSRFSPGSPSAYRPTADPAGWHVHFGRELNATDDRPHFTDARRSANCRGQTAAAFRRRRRPAALLDSAGSGSDLAGSGHDLRARPAGLSRCRLADQPADADCRDRAEGHGDDAHGLLRQGERWTKRRSSSCAGS